MARRNYHNVTLNVHKKHSRKVYARDMLPGQFAEVLDDRNTGRIIGRVFSFNANETNQFFAVDNPKSTWDVPSFEVRILEAGEVITITIGDGDRG